MSFTRVKLTPAELPAYTPALPDALKSVWPQSEIDKVKPSGHVTPQFAFAVAVDLLGLQFAQETLKASPMTLVSWVWALEVFGWNRDMENMDLQLTLLGGAIKSRCQAKNPAHALALEGLIYNEIVAATEGDQDAQDRLVKVLITERGMSVPWSLVVRTT